MKLGLVWLQNAAPRSLGWPEQKLVGDRARHIKTWEILYKNESRILPQRPSLRIRIDLRNSTTAWDTFFVDDAD